MIRERLDIMLRRRKKPRMIRIAPKEMPDSEGADVAYRSSDFPQRQIVKRKAQESSSGEESGSISDQDESKIRVPSITTISEPQSKQLAMRDPSGLIVTHPKESISSELSSTRPYSRSSKNEESTMTMFSSFYLEKSPSTDTSSLRPLAPFQLPFSDLILPFDFQDLSIEEQASYVVHVVLSKIFNHEDIGPKGGVKIEGESTSKLVVPLERRNSPQMEDHWRRKKTRILIEKMQSDLMTLHSLKPGEIREALANPEFEEVGQEFKDLYGR